MSTRTKGDRGFTLVELLIVIVILGILATVTVFAVRGLTSSAKTNACATERAQLSTSAEAYLAQKAVAAIPVATPATATVGTTASQTLVLNGFLKVVSSLYNVNADGSLSAISSNANGCT